MTQGLFALLYLRLFIIFVCPTIYQFTSILLSFVKRESVHGSLSGKIKTRG